MHQSLQSFFLLVATLTEKTFLRLKKKPEIYFSTRKQGHSLTVQFRDKLEKNSIE